MSHSSDPENFDSLTYWRNRHEQYLLDLRGVGNASLGAEENERIYQVIDTYISSIVLNLGRIKPIRVLDLGCGIGMLAEAFIRSGCEYTGVDISEKAVEIARAKYPTGRFEVSNIANLSLEGTYDIIIERTVFIHLVEDNFWRSVIKEVKRLLSPDGVFVLIDVLPRVSSEAPGGATHVKFRLYSEYQDALLLAGMRFDLDQRAALAGKMSLSQHTHLVTHA